MKKVATAEVHYIVADVGVCFRGSLGFISHCQQSKAGCQALITEFKKRENKLHVLVNNSGTSWGAPFLDFPEEKGWDNVFNVNVKSIFYSKNRRHVGVEP
jgi:NAD(P)-dependent dehydrogenase (short-subunit alcohol dehydrogenase family)